MRGAIARGALAAAAAVCAMPAADVSHLVRRERRLDLSAFACSAWPRSSTLVPSLACAWVLTAETSLHPALGRIPCCKKHKGTNRALLIAKGDTAPELASLRLHASAMCAACTAAAPGARCGLSEHGIGQVVCGACKGCGPDSQYSHVVDPCRVQSRRKGN